MEHIGIQLRTVFFQKKSGQLIVKYGQHQKHLFFQDGDLVFAKTNQPGERLGEILFKLGRISQETFRQIDHFIEPKLYIGKALLDRGLISERNLTESVIYQMKEICLNLFSVFVAGFSFQDKKTFEVLGLPAKISTPQLIEDGIRIMHSHPSVKSFLENKTFFLRSKEYLSFLTEKEQDLLSRIKGSQTAEALSKILADDSFSFWRTLYLFYCLNILDFQGDQETRRPVEAEEPPPSTFADSRPGIAEVMEFHEKLSSLNYYQILNVTREATEDEVKKSYFHLARRFHPDRFDKALLTSYREQIEEVFDRITKAYRTLSNLEERKAYDARTATASRDEEVEPSKKAEIRFRRGKTLFHQGRYEEAIVFFEESFRLMRNKGDYLLMLAMTEAMIPAFQKKAEQDFLKTQEIAPWSPESFVGLGLLYKQAELTTKAARQFAKALEIDPDHAVARKELEALDKAGKKAGLKSFFSADIFGRKKK